MAVDIFAFISRHWTFVLLAAPGAGALLWWFAGWLHRPMQRLCPGPRTVWHQDVSPVAILRRVFFHQGCGYDVSAHTGRQGAGIVCPECGTESTHNTRIRHVGGLRRNRVAALMLVFLLVVWRLPQYRYAEFVPWIPSPALIAAVDVLGQHTPAEISDELDTRIGQGLLTAAEVRQLIPTLLRDLRDDAVPGNGTAAMWKLEQLGGSAVAALEQSLSSGDGQERQLAAAVLRSFEFNYPSQRLLEVTVEGLRDDALPFGENGRLTYVFNAREGFEYLIAHAERAEAALRRALNEGDDQQRFYAARVVVAGELSDLFGAAAKELIQRLKSNEVARDEVVAARALRTLGTRVIPLLREQFDSEDAQLRTACGRLVREIGEDQLAAR